MTTDDQLVATKVQIKFEFYESNFKFENKSNLKSLGSSKLRIYVLQCFEQLRAAVGGGENQSLEDTMFTTRLTDQ